MEIYRDMLPEDARPMMDLAFGMHLQQMQRDANYWDPEDW